MQMARLDGDLTMESGDLRANAITGPMHLTTRAKDIHLEDVSGNLKINNSNGVVEYRAGKVLGDVEINNQHGTVQVMLPKNAAFQIDARTNRGDIESEFSIHPGSERSAIPPQYASRFGRQRRTADEVDQWTAATCRSGSPRACHRRPPRRNLPRLRPHRACSAAR